MTKYAYFCGHEQWQPEELVEHAVLAETAGFDMNPMCPDRIVEHFIQTFRMFRPCRVNKTRAPSLSAIPVERKLRHRQHRSANLFERAIHLAFFIFKNAQIDDFVSQIAGMLLFIIVCYTD